MSLTNQMHIEYFETCWKALIWSDWALKHLKDAVNRKMASEWWYFMPVTGMKSQICHVFILMPGSALRLMPPLQHNKLWGVVGLWLLLAQALYLWADYYMRMIEKHIPLWKDLTSVHILAFSTISLIKVTIKALIIPFCQWAVKMIFITNTSFISECVSVMIIRAVTPWSRSKSVLQAWRESGQVHFKHANNVFYVLPWFKIQMKNNLLTGLNHCSHFYDITCIDYLLKNMYIKSCIIPSHLTCFLLPLLLEKGITLHHIRATECFYQ